jgi:hypothetical protein
MRLSEIPTAPWTWLVVGALVVAPGGAVAQTTTSSVAATTTSSSTTSTSTSTTTTTIPAELKCKDRLLKRARKLNKRLTRCAVKARRLAKRGRPFDEPTCVAAALASYDVATANAQKFAETRCLACTLNARGTVRDRLLTVRTDIEPLLVCDPDVPIAVRARCEIKILKAVDQLQAKRMRCRREASTVAFEGGSPDESGCIALAKETFEKKTTGLDCPPCLDAPDAPTTTSSTIAPAGVVTTTTTTTTTSTTTLDGSTSTTTATSTTTTTTMLPDDADGIQMIQDLVGSETDAIILLAHCPCRFGGVSTGQCPECRTCGAIACELESAGTACGDDACVPSTCNANGVCTVGSPIDCDDSNVCTLDSCVDSGGCSGTNCCRNQRLTCPVDGEGAECVLNQECVPTAGCVYVCEAGCPFVGCN